MSSKPIQYIKSLFGLLIPIGLKERMDYKKEFAPNRFLGGYKKFLAEKPAGPGETVPVRNYKQVISVTGFGYSGSGAVLDLFAECDNCLNVGDSDKNTYDKVDVTIGYETDFVRLAGGLFEIEKFVGCNNFFQNDALINRFIKCIENFPPFMGDERIRNCFYEFFDEIVELKLMDVECNAYNIFLYPRKKRSSIFFLKKLTVREYRAIANKLLVKLFNILNYSNSDFLVFDQLLSDGDLDAKKNNDYISNVKSIIVYRDPRDIYAFAKKTDMPWIPHDNVDNYIIWYQIMVRNLDLNDKNNLVVQFERLITDYDNETRRILEYAGLSAESHNPQKKGKRLNPGFSIRNVGIWRQNDLLTTEFEKIKQALGMYCFGE